MMDESGEEEDEIVDVEEVDDDDEQGFLNIESANLEPDAEEDNEEEEPEQENNSGQNSEHETGHSSSKEGEEQSESDESDSSINDLSEEEQFSDHENETFPIDNTERNYEFDLPTSDAHISHLRDSMQQATQYDDNFDMHMSHYLDPANIMPSFEVVHLPASIHTSTVATETISNERGEKMQEDKRRRGRVAKSAVLSQAEQVFRESLKNLHNERDILNFIRHVEDFLNSTYGVSIFEAKRAARKHHERDLPSTFEVPKKKFPKRTVSITSILQSPESPLVRLNLREIINYKTLNLLEPHEKDSLLQYLPDVDKTSKEAVESMFSSSAFLSSLPTFQEMLAMGEFENNKDAYLQYLKGKKKRETVDAWKEKYYEDYWGQKLKNKTEAEEPKPAFSFVEWNKEHAHEDTTTTFPTHSFIKNPQQQEEEVAQMEREHSKEHHSPGKRGRKKKVKEVEEEYEAGPKVEAKPAIKKEADNDNFEAEDEDEEDEEGKPRKRKREKKNDRDYAPIQKKRERSSAGNSFRNCAYEILQREGKPLTASEIIKMALKEGLISTTGKTPQNTLASVLYCEMKKDSACPFTKVGPMTFGLKEFQYETVIDEDGKPQKKKKKKDDS